MLHNPQWDKTSLESVIGWLRKQPADGTYNWLDADNCLFAKYFDELGMDHNPSYQRMPWYVRVGSVSPRTYGAALKRAEAIRLA